MTDVSGRAAYQLDVRPHLAARVDGPASPVSLEMKFPGRLTDSNNASIIPKLRQENTKRSKATIYTLQGGTHAIRFSFGVCHPLESADEYRLCYFFRNADNQSVLVKVGMLLL
jgi:hypothetical protein